MKKFVTFLSALALVAAIPAASHAMVLPRFDDPRFGDGSALPSLDVLVNGKSYNLTGTYTATALGYNFDYSGKTAGVDVHVWGALDADPSVFYGFSATNNTGGVVDFSVLYSIPTVVDSYTYALSSFSASSTDGSNDGVAALPALAKMQHSFINGQSILGDLGVDVGDACIDPAGPPISATYGFADVSNTFAPKLTNELDVALAFSLSAHDAFTANGRTDLNTTPEPNSLALLGGGLLTFLASRRRRK